MRGAALIGPTRRVRLLGSLMLGGFLILAARAAHLTVFDSRGKGWGESQLAAVLSLPAPRGMILDRRGVELAITLQAPSVYVVPRDVEDKQATARALARVLGLNAELLATELQNRDHFTFVKRWASNREATQIRALDLAGVGILKEPRRAYPAGALAGQLIGFPNIDGKGVRGIERLEDDTLRGEKQSVRVERVAGGRLLADVRELPSTAGGDIRLTIDAALQAEAEAALARAIAKSGARGGIVVVIDPRNGDILALAEAPATNPNFFRAAEFQSTRSHAFLDALEPGSTLKAFLVAGALDAHVVSKNDMFDTAPGWLRVPGKTIRDHHDYGRISVGEILQVSSNVGAVMLAQLLASERHYDVLRRFGFGERTGSGFPEESAGIIRHHRDWKPIDQAAMAFGQGIGVTPVQLAVATATLASEGVRRTPRLIAARRHPGGEWEDAPLDAGQRVVSAETAAETLRMLELVVSESGTGRRAGLRGVRVAGKTGTAQKFDRKAGRYSKSAFLAWFIGVAPADDPQLAMAVVIDEPQGRTHGGGDTAAPVFAQVAAARLARLGITTAPAPIRPKRFRTLVADVKPKLRKPARPVAKPLVARAEEPKSVEEIARAKTIETPIAQLEERQAAHASPPPKHLVPDLRGETWQAAQRIAAQSPFELEPAGDQRGLAVEQYPFPGTVVTGEHPRIQLRFTQDREEG